MKSLIKNYIDNLSNMIICSRDDNGIIDIPDGYKENIYQITMSGIAAKGIYLTNTLTGATWTLYEDKNGELFWGAISFPE